MNLLPNRHPNEIVLQLPSPVKEILGLVDLLAGVLGEILDDERISTEIRAEYVTLWEIRMAERAGRAHPSQGDPK